MQSGQAIPFSPQVEAFFQASDEIYQRAARLAVSRDFRIGDHLVRLSFAGPALMKMLTPAFAHLAVEPGNHEPELTICAWDSVSTGTRMPPPPWPDEDRPQNSVSFGDGDIRGAIIPWAGVLNLLDFGRRRGLFWIYDAAQLPYSESAAPFLPIFNWWMRRHGQQLVHSAAVGTCEGGLLIVGEGGAGKSTTALAALNAGLVYAGDDYCLLAQEPFPYVYSLYSSIRSEPAGMQARFPHLMPAVANPTRLDNEKALVFLHDYDPARVVTGFPVRAVLIPSITGRADTSIVPATPAAALRATAPTTIFYLPGAGAAELRLIASFMRQVPCYHLQLGTDLRGVAQALWELLPDG